MRLTLPLLAFLSLIIVLMLRFRHRGDGLTWFEFLLCATWGFLLAQSAFAPLAQNLLNAVVSQH
jgi:hypothetical protein